MNDPEVDRLMSIWDFLNTYCASDLEISFTFETFCMSLEYDMSDEMALVNQIFLGLLRLNTKAHIDIDISLGIDSATSTLIWPEILKLYF